MSGPSYDAMLWAAADRYMSGNGTPEGEVSFTIERDVADLPEVLRLHLPADAECVGLSVYCEVDDETAVVIGWVDYDEARKRYVTHKTAHVTIPLTRHETEWTREVAIQQAEHDRDDNDAAYEAHRDRELER